MSDPPKNSRPEIVGIPLHFHFLEPNIFRADFLLTGDLSARIALNHFFVDFSFFFFSEERLAFDCGTFVSVFRVVCDRGRS